MLIISFEYKQGMLTAKYYIKLANELSNKGVKFYQR